MSRIHFAVASIALAATGCGGVPVNAPIDVSDVTATPVAVTTVETTPAATPSDHDLQVLKYYAALEQLEKDRRALQLDPQLTCTRYWESDRGPSPHINGYGAVSSGGTYRGAYQFLPSTWNGVASRHGRPDLVGVLPDKAAWYDQDSMAAALRSERGMQPWGGRCA